MPGPSRLPRPTLGVSRLASIRPSAEDDAHYLAAVAVQDAEAAPNNTEEAPILRSHMFTVVYRCNKGEYE